MTRQHLIFDADDTLWENNIYFEEVFDEFCEYLNHSTLTPDEIRAVLDEIEIVNNKIHGYGALNLPGTGQCLSGLRKAMHVSDAEVEHGEVTGESDSGAACGADAWGCGDSAAIG